MKMQQRTQRGMRTKIQFLLAKQLLPINIEDFLILSCLVGNDFLPAIPSIEIKESYPEIGALDYLIKKYKEIIKTENFPLVNNGFINFRLLGKFIKSFSSRELNIMIARDHDQSRFINFLWRSVQANCTSSHDYETKHDQPEEIDNFVHDVARNAAEHPEFFTEIKNLNTIDAHLIRKDPSKIKNNGIKTNINKKTLTNMINNYRKQYHITKLNECNKSDLVYNYMKTVQWVYQYYTTNFASWTWYYPYSYALHTDDMARFMPSIKQFYFPKSFPCNFNQQLLHVMPYDSKNLLPKHLHKIFITLPFDIKIDRSGKREDWEAIVIV